MTTELQFDSLPSMLSTYGRALTDRKSTKLDGTIPRIEAHLDQVAIKRAEIEKYNEVCKIVEPKDGRIASTFPQVLAGPVHGQIITNENFPLPAMGVVHVEQTIRYHKPIYPGDRLSLDCWVEGHEEHRSGVTFDLMTEFKVGLDVVWEGITTAIVKQPHKKKDKTKSKRDEPKPGAPENLDRSTTWSLPAGLGRQYAGVSGDYNPIHLFGPTAKLFGFKRQIIHGMWSIARAIGELDVDVPELPYELKCEFKKPIYLPSKVVFSSRQTDSGQEFWIHSPDGEIMHVIGELSAVG